MDEQYELNGISFVWNRRKAQRNAVKHGISFEQAADAFFDPFIRVVDAGTEEEARDAAIGMDVQWNLLYVVHIAFEDSHIRIISARTATAMERRLYES